jgi:hypothetical protein
LAGALPGSPGASWRPRHAHGSSHGESGKPEKTHINVNTVCLKTLDLLAYQFKVYNITVAKHLADDLPETMADGRQLQ